MFVDIVKAFMNMCAGFFSWRTVSEENLTSKEVVKDKQNCEEACDYAERAFEVVERGAVFSKRKYQRRYRSMVRRFRELK